MGHVAMECENSSKLRTELGLGQPACCSKSKPESQNTKKQSSGRYYHLKCADGDFGELHLDQIPNFHCKSMPTRSRETNLADNAVLKRGSVYHSSGEVRRMRKLKEGRRKIDSRMEGDAFLPFEIVDSSSQPSNREAVLCSRQKQPPLVSSSAEQPPASETARRITRSSMEFLELSFRDLPGKTVKPDCSYVGDTVLKNDLTNDFLEICLENENTITPCKNLATGFPERGSLKGLKPNDRPLDKSFSAKDINFKTPCRSSVHAVDVKAQSSPLKRMLDSIMKSKSLRTLPLVETEAVKNLHTVIGNRNAVSRKSLLHDFSKAMPKTESNGESGREDQPSATTSSPAHLHATLKSDYTNGAPALEFCVKDPEEVLSAKTWKTDSAFNWVYTFHGHSKRSTSTGRSSKDKHGFSPPIIGQMQASCYLCSEVAENGAAIDSIVTEFVLYGTAQAGRSFAIDNSNSDALNSYPWSQMDLHPHQEIASVVVQIPFNKMGRVNDIKSESANSCVDQGRPVTFRRSYPGSIEAITPSGLHGLPPSADGGSPSSLLDKWRHGGGCDCGGWDMACPLVVFKNDFDARRASNMAKESKQPLMLFVQGSKEKAPALTITTDEKGMYSIDFHAQLSALQAFSICVAFLHSFETSPLVGQEKSKHKLCSGSLKLLLEEEVRNLIEAVANEEKKKTKKKVEPAPPFMLDPPFSPMGRL